MTSTQKISWINEKISSLIEEIHRLQQENKELRANDDLAIQAAQYEQKLVAKESVISQLKLDLKAREAEIDDVVAKIDLLLQS